MAFRFSLAAVLQLQQTLEDRARLRLTELFSQRGRLLLEIDALGELRLHRQQGVHASLAVAALPAVEIQFATSQIQSVEQSRARLQYQVAEMEEILQQQILRYQAERRKREVLDSLRTAQLRDYQLEQSHREQAQLDELYLLRRARQRSVDRFAESFTRLGETGTTSV